MQTTDYRDAQQVIRALLYERFRAQSTPLLVAHGGITPAASLWTGARCWVGFLRRVGIRPGDRVVLSLPFGPGHVMVTIACWFEGVTLCVARPCGDSYTKGSHALVACDARLMIADTDWPQTVRPEPAGDPPGPSEDFPDEPMPRVTLRAALQPERPDLCMLFYSSLSEGTSANDGAALLQRHALTYGDILERLSRCAASAPADGTVRCPEVWSASEALLERVWPALLAGCTIAAESSAPRSVAAYETE